MVSGCWFQAVGASAVDMGKSDLRSSIRSILKTLPWILAEVVSQAQSNVNLTTCFDIFPKKMYDVFLMVRTLKYGTVARFFRKCTKNVDETLPEPSGTLRAKYGIYWWKKRQLYDVFLHIYEKRRQFYDVFWHIGKNLVNFTTCFDTFSKKMSISRRVFEGQNAEVRYCCTIFSKKYEKRRRDAPGTLRAPDGLLWPGLLP